MITYNPDVGLSLEECFMQFEGTIKYFATIPKNLAKLRLHNLNSDDLISVGNYALIKAYQSFVMKEGREWKKHLEHTISFHILNFFNSQGFGDIYIPYDTKKLYNKVKLNLENLDDKGMIKFSPEEISLKFKCSLTLAECILQCEYIENITKTSFSLDKQGATNSKKNSVFTKKKPYSGFNSSIENKVIYKDLLGALTERERTVILKKLEGYSMREIGIMIGFSQQTVLVTLNKIKKKIRNYYSFEELENVFI